MRLEYNRAVVLKVCSRAPMGPWAFSPVSVRAKLTYLLFSFSLSHECPVELFNDMWYCKGLNSEADMRTSLVAQWLRICLPMQGTWVRALVREDPTCPGATKPVHHSYWACALEPVCHNYWGCMPQLLKPVHLEPMLRNKRSHRDEKPVPQRRVAPARHN